MKQQQLIKHIQVAIQNTESEFVTIYLQELIKEIKKSGVQADSYYVQKTIREDSQKGLILAHMQKNIHDAFCGTDFMKILSFKPFVGYEATARLSELKRMGLVNIVGKIKSKRRDRYLYKITKKGIDFKLH